MEFCDNKCTDKCKTMREKLWRDNLVDKVHEDPSLGWQCLFKNPSAMTVTEWGAWRTCGPCWPASLTDLVNSRLSKKPCFKKPKWKMIKRNC